MTVTPVNDAPVAADDSLVVREDTTGRVNVLANDADVDGDPLSVSLLSRAAHGTASCTAAGVCTYTPVANFAGRDAFRYTLSDGRGGTTSATVNVAVTPVADPLSAPPKPKAKSGKRGDRRTTVKVSWRKPGHRRRLRDQWLRGGRGEDRGRRTGAVRYFDFRSRARRATIVLPRGRYKFKVAATNAAGSGPYSRLSRKVIAR